eukprot:gnl/MRDRNA2_/MRDRNA2_140740_c0_seq1.p1 gnl/MRDRNA2_/MRDRNA2_140740_c0~~gnl/MRDRNA2_/MRDRNA2_140740_c0_seq1.p1  ORF type:complete len:248 (+),score=42.45 gnl/MRDRNA2_/MRDRNA2_140740_c0_seq1:97-744(+)
MTNPPFHESPKYAMKSNKRKWHGLGLQDLERNYQGVSSELCCDGGEVGFVKRLANESSENSWRNNCIWFSAMLSRNSSKNPIMSELKALDVTECKIIPLAAGKQLKWVVAWSFLPLLEREARLQELHKAGRDGVSQGAAKGRRIPEEMQEENARAGKRQRLESPKGDIDEGLPHGLNGKETILSVPKQAEDRFFPGVFCCTSFLIAFFIVKNLRW